MKKLITFFVATFLLGIATIGQTPQAFKYQAVARDTTGNVLANQNVSFQISILQGSVTGTSVYVETHNTITNDFGLVNLEIGNGTPVSGYFTTIDWGTDSYFLKTEMDETGGTNYQLMGTSQLLSVPYALQAGNAATDNDWTVSGNDMHSAVSGNVGIGTTNPNYKLEVGGNVEANGFTINGVPVGTSTDSYWSESSGNIYYNSGNVGIGTTDPQTKFEVNGPIALNRAFLNLAGNPTYTLTPEKSFYFIVADPSGTTLTLADGTAQGQFLIILESMGYPLTILDGSNTRLNGNWVAGSNDMIFLIWAHAWVEISRSDN